MSTVAPPLSPGGQHVQRAHCAGLYDIPCSHLVPNYARKHVPLLFLCSFRWAEVVTHIPCTGVNPDGGEAGELRISALLEDVDGEGGVLGFAGPSAVWFECQGISYSGEMTFDTGDVDVLEQGGTLEGVILHEMGHVIGSG